MTTATITTNKPVRKVGTITTTTQDLAFGAVCGHRLLLVDIPGDYCQIAAATCQFNFMGWHRGMHDGTAPRNEVRHHLSGRWAHVSLATYGHLPTNTELWRAGKSDRARYCYADNFEAVNLILDCFDLTADEVIAWATDGQGLQDDDRIELSLRAIIEALRPELIESDGCLRNDDHANARQQSMGLG